MIQEMMGQGLMKYYIAHNAMPNFNQKLLLLLNYLPHKKMCLYLQQFILDEPFDCSPRIEIINEINNQRFNMKHPLMRTK